MEEVEIHISNAKTIRYYLKGTNSYHREDGPAIEYANGVKYYYQYDRLHREDGPAVENPSLGYEIYYFRGKKIDCSSTEEFLKIIKLKAFW